MKTSTIKFALIMGMIASTAVFASGEHEYSSPIDTATYTGSIAGTQAGVNFGTNAGGMSFSQAGAWNKNSASAQIEKTRSGIESSSKALSESGAWGFNKSYGVGSYGGGFAEGTGFAGAAGSAGSLGE
jgi:hypothetical protein